MTFVSERIAAQESPINVFVHAAGMGTTAPFPDAPLSEEEAMLRLNVLSTLRLTHAAADAMRQRGSGSIMLISSTAAYWSASTYAASKSWVLTMSLGLRTRLAPAGIRVLAVSPGFTRTEFHARSSTDASGVQPWLWLDATDVAVEALNALDADRGVCVPGRRYRALVETVRHLPPGGRAAVLRRIAPLKSANP
jgi:short-subunit dehydrogenase